MNQKVGKIIYKLFSYRVLYWIIFPEINIKLLPCLQCVSPENYAAYIQKREAEISIMSRFDPLKELCSVILLFWVLYKNTDKKQQ